MNQGFDIIVKKFGGSSLATPEKLTQVAQFIRASLEPGKKVVVVVSAMGHTTNQLISLAYELNPDPPKRELDMLTSCGERSSMALLAMALAKIDVKALSLTGSQSGIITDEHHSSAKIIAIRPQRVLEALIDSQVVIVAGFQGVSREREITTLKRGGSDTTAVAMAAALKACACEIYTDVAGVMDADPSIIKHAQKIAELDHELMSSMSLYGAKIMAYDAALLAQELGVSLLIAQSTKDQGSKVFAEVAIKSTANTMLKAISHLRGIMRLAAKIDEYELNNSYFLCGHMVDGYIHGYVSNDLAQEFRDQPALSVGLALICLHLNHPADNLKVLARATKLLGPKALLDAILGDNKIFLITKDEELNQDLNSLYEMLL